VSAANEDISALIASNRFRVDLAHRLAGVMIRVPSLAEHIDDLPAMVRHFLDRAGFTAVGVTARALDALKQRTWPGNVRELKHFVEWAALVAREELDEHAVSRALATRWLKESVEGVTAEALQLRALLERHGWNRALAAQELGIHRATIYRRMRRLGILATG
jgi:DNA-binding NtrC family response regulator